MAAKMTRSEAGRKGGLARAKQFTRASQQAARRKVSSESCAANGSLGAKATLAKHGREMVFQAWRRWKLNHPSNNELLVIGILAQLKVANDRDWRVGKSYFTVDFKLRGLKKCIEVNGRIHNIFDQEKRAICKAKKADLLAEMGIECLTIDYTELADVPAVIEKINQFVGGVDRQSAPAQTGNR